MADSRQEPANAYERALDRAGLDCSWFACWKPAEVMILNRHGEPIPSCREHVQGALIVKELEQ